jgi:hypothetical protein
MRKLSSLTACLGLLLLSLYLLAQDASATTYYISASTGSDSNSGTSKSSAWAHLPGMANATGTAAGHTPVGGDRYVLMGCGVWSNQSFAINWSWSGTSGNPIYVGGGDTTWYNTQNCPSSWNRPVFNAGGNVITGGGNKNDFIVLNGNFVTIDNIEFTGMFWTNSYTSFGDTCYIAKGGGTWDAITNNYFHGWSYSASTDALYIILGNTSGTDTGSYAAYNVFDGSDTSGVSGNAIYGSPGVVYQNYCGHMANCFVGEFSSMHDNLIEYLQPHFDGGHSNAIEATTDIPYGQWAGGGYSGIGALYYNNVIRHLASGIVSLWPAPWNNTTTYIFNNVIYDVDNANVMNLNGDALAGAPYGSGVTANNTAECGPDSNPIGACTSGANSPLETSAWENNHYITSSNPPVSGTAVGVDTYVLQTLAAANNQGYSSSTTFAFSPASASAATHTFAGSNLTSTCNSSPVLAPLCQDTTYAVSYNTSDHVVTYPARSPNSRPGSGQWDAGAYQYNGTSSTNANTVTAPNAPTNLTVTVH